MIQIPLTEAEHAEAARKLDETQGIKLDGPEGKVSKMGVTFAYKYADGVLTLDLVEKPFFVTTDYVYGQLKAWLAKS